MSARTKARKRALDLLYSADMRGIALSDALSEEAARAARQPDRGASWAYAAQIAQGVVEHGDEVDELITTYSRDWPLDRMPAVDRAVLRVATWEVAFNPEVPAAVAISEAVEQAQALSTEDSARFVNGVLGRIAASLG
ncbi:MAG: transcription antitermination factor NusB [Micrococcales bacterium 73-13]|nr:MAG: transcription antitermination factor NusB [Micrococcales bacterium 73-13]